MVQDTKRFGRITIRKKMRLSEKSDNQNIVRLQVVLTIGNNELLKNVGQFPPHLLEYDKSLGI